MIALRHSELLTLTWLGLITAAVVCFVLGNLGLGAWTYTTCLLLLALFLLIPVFCFRVHPDLTISLFNSLAGNAIQPINWSQLSGLRRSVIRVCVLLCAANGLLLLLSALSRLF